MRILVPDSDVVHITDLGLGNFGCSWNCNSSRLDVSCCPAAVTDWPVLGRRRPSRGLKLTNLDAMSFLYENVSTGKATPFSTLALESFVAF